jgi:hypothetical protein
MAIYAFLAPAPSARWHDWAQSDSYKVGAQSNNYGPQDDSSEKTSCFALIPIPRKAAWKIFQAIHKHTFIGPGEFAAEYAQMRRTYRRYSRILLLPRGI